MATLTQNQGATEPHVVDLSGIDRRADDGDNVAAEGEGSGDALPSGDATSFSDDDRTERIAHRAYERYQARGGGHCQDVDDWRAAEREFDGGDQN